MKLTTAVIGAGPAGLLFSLIGKILFRDDDRWALRLYDKRETYLRTHRLRMAPEPYLAIQRDLEDPRFDSLMALLREHDFSPEVNLLETKLSELLASMGVRKTVLEFGAAFTLVDLKRRLEGEGLLPGPFTVVAADSVHSTVREWVRGELAPQRHTHERVARLRVTGDGLPSRLSVADQFRLSKVLGSVVDYRLNRNGFAEIDLFLTEREHRRVSEVGASPGEPIEITSGMLRKLDAPLFRAVVEHLERGGRRVLVQSTFQLEHAVMPRVDFAAPDAGARVFLVGDAAASLPFFRGMACLASCAHALARAHHDGDFDRYDREAAEVARREVAIVRSRARLVRGLRELVRLSSLLPFPIQSWWLSAGRDPVPDRMSPGAWLNLIVAIVAAALSASKLAVPWLWLASLPVQMGGGFAYRWTLDLEPGPHRHLRRIWEIQLAVLLAAGAALAAFRRVPPLAAAWGWILGVAFVLGLYLFEWLVARHLSRARLD